MQKQKIEIQIAEILLNIKAVTLHTETPAVWTSGQLTPIYCNNRKISFYPENRAIVIGALATEIIKGYPQTEVIAGVASAGERWGMAVALELGLPYVGARAKAKEHGAKGKIEGESVSGKKVFVVEDLFSTGGSTLEAIAAVEENGGEVVGAGSIFSYGFHKANEKLAAKLGGNYFSLSNYASLISVAADMKYISEAEYIRLAEWHQNPNKYSVERNGPAKL